MRTWLIELLVAVLEVFIKRYKGEIIEIGADIYHRATDDTLVEGKPDEKLNEAWRQELDDYLGDNPAPDP